ncbi:tetratricopeptide repeat protein [Marmoricola sp. RAF53]|uniref:tetratricopeptide repeat protein n=1 Tax=Marmoricola sp. RAF53 TaxID=3233059 RepID=UPI003F9999B1
MADDRKSSNPRGGARGGKPAGVRTSSSRDSKPTSSRSGKPSSSRDGKPASRGPKRDDEKRPYSRARRDDAAGTRSAQGGGRRGDWKGKPGADRTEDRTADQKRYDGPEIPEHITGKELDRSVRDQLKSLPEKLGLRVARHLAAAEEVLESDPRTAYEHTLAARARAARLAVVREAVGEAAYAAGEYAEALAELRAAKRMNGAHEYVAIMADCERALGRPDRALALLKNAPRDKFSAPLTAETVIVEAGARRDRKEYDAALRILEQSPLNSKSRAPWVARLRYTYAETLLEAGRPADALEWFHRTEAIDTDEVTDAGARAAEVERTLAQG